MRFTKGHGTANDFVLLDDPGGALALTDASVAAICDRRRGVGADGILRVVRTAYVEGWSDSSDTAEWFMDYRNADGSAVEMCGNGIRVFARYLADRGLVDGTTQLDIATRDGVKRVWLADGGQVTVDMGTPRDAALLPDDAVYVSMGNPHVVLFADDLATAPVLTVGPAIEGEWDGGTNVEFVRVVDRTAIGMRVWERGVGETMSCGTGACASAVAAHLRGYADRAVDVSLPGGSLQVEWTAGDTVLMTGPAVLAYDGDLRPEWLAATDLTIADQHPQGQTA
ncbi:MAG TPA: diaminopimelate epimerase [Mycobacteriales bacterium]|nr:diaminopimelate epimerase [Mycobacteriales bacterium]